MKAALSEHFLLCEEHLVRTNKNSTQSPGVNNGLLISALLAAQDALGVCVQNAGSHLCRWTNLGLRRIGTFVRLTKRQENIVCGIRPSNLAMASENFKCMNPYVFFIDRPIEGCYSPNEAHHQLSFQNLG